MSFTAKNLRLTGGFSVKGSVDFAFNLFSPLGEKSWVMEWDPELLHPPGVAWERGLIFRTKEAEGDAIWLVTDLDRAGHHVEYHRVESTRYVARVEVRCRALSPAETEVQVSYEFIGLSKEGNEQIGRMTEDDYKTKMSRWQNWIGTYLEGQHK